MDPYLLAAILATVITIVVYTVVGWQPIADCMRMWLRRDYWTAYNTVEFLAWGTKAAVIVPGLVFGFEIWWLHVLTLGTSVALIWASMRKLLPTLIAFNTLWIFLSMTVIVRRFMEGGGA
ncbi:hypothetical protein [Parvularcula lutaonensis]|uniref:Uncharacterized protein n=1 Tax=Parvularcula lutaonensis TaxID=491923 RepID=A0ABV7MDS4_9PROT|nr:hypothetical protein [Parvularcula lutaonensis]GGY53880.1 hypothetical protein GCM10007148_24050 [Parvularcula lutaonensis]